MRVNHDELTPKDRAFQERKKKEEKDSNDARKAGELNTNKSKSMIALKRMWF